MDDIRSGDAFPHLTRLMQLQGNCTPGAYKISQGIVSDFSHGILGIGGDKDTTEAQFFIFCIPFGAIRPSVVTSGPDQDPDGYQIRFERVDTEGSSPKWFDDDGDIPPDSNVAPRIPIGVNGQTLLDSLIPINPQPPGNGATGAFRLSLEDVRKNCAVARPTSHSVVSYSGDTVQTTFQVQCIHLGAVMARSTLQDPDPVTGFPVVHSATVTEKDAGTVVASVTLVASDSSVAGQLIPLFAASGADGRHTTALVPQANRCTPQGGGSRAVTVLSADTTIADYVVTCVERFHLRNVTFGNGTPDPDGYQVVIDGGQTIDVATNGTVPVAGLIPGGHTLGYTGLASNCGLRVAPPSATVPTADSTLVEFQVECGTFTGPSGLSAVATGPDAIQLDWVGGNDPVHGVVWHRVYRDGVVFDSVVTPLVTWSDTTLASNESHDYAVTAVNGQGTESAPSSTVLAATLPDAPGNLVATPISDTRIDLSWTAPSGVIGQYRVTRTGLDTLVAGTAFSDTGLSPSTTYGYQVSAFGVTGLEGPAAADSATTLPATTGGLQVLTQTTGLPSAMYTVVLEGPGGFSQDRATVAANDQVLFSPLAPGDYTVILPDPPAGCTVAAPNPRIETVQVGVLTQTTFVITCGEAGQ